MPIVRSNVRTIAKSGSVALRGDVTLTEGANVSLTQSAQDVSIAAFVPVQSVAGRIGNVVLVSADLADLVSTVNGLIAGASLNGSQITVGTVPFARLGLNATNTEIGYLSGVTSGVQGQINGKQASLGFTPENAANKNAASGYAGLSASSKIAASQVQEVLGAVDLTDYTGTSGSGVTAIRSTITGPIDNQVLTYSSGNWINQALPSGGLISGLTVGRLPKAASATSLADSILSEASSAVTAAGDLLAARVGSGSDRLLGLDSPNVSVRQNDFADTVTARSGPNFTSLYEFSSRLTLNPSADWVSPNAFGGVGITSFVQSTAANSRKISSLMGGYYQVQHLGDGDVGSVTGFSVDAETDAGGNHGTVTGASLVALHAGTGTVGAVHGLFIETGNFGAGALSDDRSIYVASPGSSGTLAAHYGLYMDDQAFGATNYALYTNNGKVRFGDALAVTGILTAGSGPTTLTDATGHVLAAALNTVPYSKLNLTGAIVNDDVASAAAIAWSKLDKTGSSLADLTTRSASDLAAGTLADARQSANVMFVDGTRPFTAAVSGMDPMSSTHLATKAYVDQVASGLSVKAPVRVASTANIASLSGLLTVDGVTVASGDRVLVKDQTTGSQNGIYAAASGAWSRATDADASSEVKAGLSVWVDEGTTNADSQFVLTTDDPIIVGTTALTFSQVSGLGQITAGDGLTKTGNRLDVAGTLNRIIANADSIDIASGYVGQASITTLGTIATGVWQGTIVDVAHGGTNAGTASGARANLGLAIGSNVEAWSANLDTLSALAAVRGSLMVGDGAPAWSRLATGTANKVLVTDGTDPSWALLTTANLSATAAIANAQLANSSITITGTANQVIVSSSPVSLGGSTTLSLPQSIDTTATPQFAGASLGEAIPANVLFNVKGSVAASAAVARATRTSVTLTAAADSDTLTGNFSNITFADAGHATVVHNLFQYQNAGVDKWVVDGTGALTIGAVPSTLLTGTIPDARFPATLPAASGVNLTALNATNLGSGTVPDARFPATLPAASGVNLTALNGSNVASGTVGDARLSANVALLAAANTFSTAQTISYTATTTTPSLMITPTWNANVAQVAFKVNATDTLSGSAWLADFQVGSVSKASIDKAGNVALAGTLTAGSSATVLTDSAGKILSASLNTVAIANGGTGATAKTAAFDALSPNTTKGDIVAHDGTDSVRLGVGADAQVLSADSTTATGLKWITNAASGANAALSNLASVAVNVALRPSSAAALDFGSAALPWKDLWLAGSSGTPASNNFRLTGTATAARVVTLPDAASYTLAGLSIAQTFTAIQTMTNAGIGATSTDELVLNNTTAAANNAQQWSPRLRFTGQGWKSNATAASQTDDWIIENQTAQGAAASTANLAFSNQIAGGGYTSIFTMQSGGVFLLTASGGVSFNTRSKMTSPADSQIRFDNSTTNGLAALILGSDANAPVANVVSVGNANTGQTNVAGALWTFNASRGTGTGAGGDILFQTAAAGSSGTAQNALAEQFRVKNTGGVVIGAGTAIKKVLSATAVLDFPSTLAAAESTLTITVTGAALGDPVILGVPNASVASGANYQAYVSAADTVTVKLQNVGTVAVDPASGTFRVAVMQF